MGVRGRTIVLLATGALVVACGSGHKSAPSATPTTHSTHSTKLAYCIAQDTGAKDQWTGDQEVLTLGSGPKGVLLAPQIDGAACGWSDEMHRLAGKGYHVAAVNYGLDQPASISAGVKTLRAAGVTNIVLMGASAGGGLVLDESADIAPPVAGTIGVSPVQVWPTGSGLAKYTGPLLLLAARSDTEATADSVRAFAATHPGDERTIFFDGYTHGYDLVAAESGVRAAIDDFLAKQLT
jgi:hypothetical protein